MDAFHLKATFFPRYQATSFFDSTPTIFNRCWLQFCFTLFLTTGRKTAPKSKLHFSPSPSLSHQTQLQSAPPHLLYPINLPETKHLQKDQETTSDLHRLAMTPLPLKKLECRQYQPGDFRVGGFLLGSRHVCVFRTLRCHRRWALATKATAAARMGKFNTQNCQCCPYCIALCLPPIYLTH